MANIHQVFTPYNGFILVKPIKLDNEEFVVARNMEKQPADMGEVVAIGGAKLHESGEMLSTGIMLNDIVVFRPYAIEEITLNGVEHRIVPFENIRGVITNEK